MRSSTSPAPVPIPRTGHSSDQSDGTARLPTFRRRCCRSPGGHRRRTTAVLPPPQRVTHRLRRVRFPRQLDQNLLQQLLSESSSDRLRSLRRRGAPQESARGSLLRSAHRVHRCVGALLGPPAICARREDDENFPTHVRPAGRLLNASARVQLAETRIAISFQSG